LQEWDAKAAAAKADYEKAMKEYKESGAEAEFESSKPESSSKPEKSSKSERSSRPSKPSSSSSSAKLASPTKVTACA
jgi:hypothetical protein